MGLLIFLAVVRRCRLAGVGFFAVPDQTLTQKQLAYIARL